MVITARFLAKALSAVVTGATIAACEVCRLQSQLLYAVKFEILSTVHSWFTQRANWDLIRPSKVLATSFGLGGGILKASSRDSNELSELSRTFWVKCFSRGIAFLAIQDLNAVAVDPTIVTRHAVDTKHGQFVLESLWYYIFRQRAGSNVFS